MGKKNNFLITFFICFKGNFTHSRRVASQYIYYIYILYSPTTLYNLISLRYLLFFNVFCYLTQHSSVFLSSCRMLSGTFSLSYSLHRLVSQESSLKLVFSSPKLSLLAVSYIFATPWTVFLQVPLSSGFSMQGYWSGLPFPCLGDLSSPRIKLASPAWQEDSVPLSHLGSLPYSYISRYFTSTVASL